jgi:hypothetical protein
MESSCGEGYRHVKDNVKITELILPVPAEALPWLPHSWRFFLWMSVPTLGSLTNTSLNLYSTAATIRTNCFNIKRLCILPTQCIYVFRMLLGTNDNYIPNSTNWLVFMMKMQYVLCETGTEFLYYLDKLQTSMGYFYILCISVRKPVRKNQLRRARWGCKNNGSLRHRTWEWALDKICPEQAGFFEHVNEISGSVKSRQPFIPVGLSSEEEVCCVDCIDHVWYTGCGISQLTENADNECKNEAKAQIATC